MSRPAQVTNAADKRQVASARRYERDAETSMLAGLRAAMSTPAGRRGLGEFIERLGPLRSVWDHSGAVMNYNEGRRSVAVELIGLLEDADPDLYLQLKREIEQARLAALRSAQAVQMTSKERTDE